MRLGTIIFILVIAWSVVNAIISHIAAKKKQEQEAERMRARRAAAGTGGAAPAESSAGRPQRTKMDDLIARRKAQIEELRAQRETRRSSGAADVRVGDGRQAVPQLRDVGTFQAPAPIAGRSTQSLPPTRSTPSPGRMTSGTTVPVGRGAPGRAGARLPTGQLDVARARQETQRRIGDAQQQRQRAEQARKEQEQRATRLRERAEAQAADRAADAILVGTPYELTERGGGASRVRSRLGSAQSLRELFLLKEILDRPVSLRE